MDSVHGAGVGAYAWAHVGVVSVTDLCGTMLLVCIRSGHADNLYFASNRQ